MTASDPTSSGVGQASVREHAAGPPFAASAASAADGPATARPAAGTPVVRVSSAAARLDTGTFSAEIVELLASPAHRYEGRPADGPLPAPAGGGVRDELEIRAGLGVVGDRYFAKAAHARASVTFQSAEALEALAEELALPVPGLAQTRRTVLLRGMDADALVGRDFTVDTGNGPIAFRAHRPARPCGWMDVVIGDGAHRAMRGRGGIRTEPLSSGVLRVGPATVMIGEPLPPRVT